ncbi:hypothetical protein MNEG_11308 [Monoraphidium neglectum]|uniref:Uncharacterized protein n=1 Tax=Monoraphidium neglectum TaxID=145388 RepID=A0A0D2MPV2_9CHLO|nr:hypothetical protein MNEG_11308 [Monoraphidium neglectum]KIY96655.1 hypothetical protein MNEG_11308 [Monoraphidium neglectum]|eukprot:XP_013895675.1 hypothetical protein MNEG_11308 [Monoraphidium neglectum]
MKAAVSPGAPPKSSIIHLEKLPNSLADYTSDMHGHLEAIRLCEEASAFLARPAQAPWAVLQAQLKLLRAQLVSVYGMYLASGYSRGFMESLAPFVGFMPIADNPGGAILMNDTACKQQAGWGLQQVVRVTCAGFLYLNQDHAVARTNLEAVAGWLANDENRRGLAPELEGFAVSLTPNELHWVVLNLLYKLLVLMMPQASKSQAAREALLDAQRQAGFKMVKALPHKADGYWRAGTPCFNQVNARLALS